MSDSCGPGRVRIARPAFDQFHHDLSYVRRWRGGQIIGRRHQDTVSYWDGDGVPGTSSITINLGEQKAFFYKDGRLVGVSMISSGREGYRTPSGQYKIIQKSKDHVSNLYGDYVDQDGNVMVANVGVKRDAKPPGTSFRGAPMPYFYVSTAATACMPGFSRALPPRMVACACPSGWRKFSSPTFHGVRRCAW